MDFGLRLQDPVNAVLATFAGHFASALRSFCVGSTPSLTITADFGTMATWCPPRRRIVSSLPRSERM